MVLNDNYIDVKWNLFGSFKVIIKFIFLNMKNIIFFFKFLGEMFFKVIVNVKLYVRFFWKINLYVWSYGISIS